MVELHDTFSVPGTAGARSRIAVDHGDLVTPAGKGNAGVKSGWSRTDNDCLHVVPAFSVTLRVMNTLTVT
jgi:hypothetical protein